MKDIEKEYLLNSIDLKNKRIEELKSDRRILIFTNITIIIILLLFKI